MTTTSSARAADARPSKNWTWKSRLAAGAAGLVALYAFALLFEGFVADGYSGLATWPFIDKPAAERAVDRLPASAGPAAFGQAARRLVEADPSNPESWVAVAYADRIGHGKLTQTGIEALDHSYAVSFFDRRGAVFRIAFALENWEALAPETRRDVVSESDVVMRDDALRPILAQRLTRIRDPAGRVAAALILAASARP